MASERTSHLTNLDPTGLGGKKEREKKEREREEGKREFRERGSTFSPGFPSIDSSNPDEIRGKVDPHYKSYAWVPVL